METLKSTPWLLIIPGAILRLIGLGRDALWYDEAFTAWLARLPLAPMMDAIAGDVHPPLWYWIEAINVRLFGSSELALRAPACLIGIVNLVLAWQVARRLAPRPVALLATGIFAFAPFQIYYSHEARMYQLLQFAVLLAVWAVLARAWACLAIAGLVGLLTQNLMVIYLVPIFGLALGRDWIFFQGIYHRLIHWRWLRSWPPLWTGLVIGLNFAPWAWWILIPQLAEIRAGFWVQPVTPGGFFYPVYVLFFHQAAPSWLSLHAGIVAMALVLWGSLKAPRSIALLAWGPLAILALISLIWQPVYLHRALIGSSLFFYLLAAFAIVRVARVLAQPVGMIAVAGVPLIISTGYFYLGTEARRWDVRPDIATVVCEPGDVVYHLNPASLVLFEYYLPACDHWLWPASNDLSQSLTQRTKRAMGIQQANLDDIPHRRRAWLIWAETPVLDESEPGAVEAILLANNRLIHETKPAETVTLRVWEVWR